MTFEFYQALKWSVAAFACGILLREYSPESLGKWLGRSGVLIALFVMTAFSIHSVRQCSHLTQLVKQNKKADEVGEQTITALVNSTGHKLLIGLEKNGMRRISCELRQYGPIVPAGRDSESSRDVGISATRMGIMGSNGRVDDGWHNAGRLPAWAKWFTRTRADDRIIPFTGKAQGKDF